MLTVKWHVISISKNQLKDIHDLLDASDLQMKQCVLASYASSLAAINEMESSLGVICLDINHYKTCLLYTSPSPRDKRQSRMPSSA